MGLDTEINKMKIKQNDDSSIINQEKNDLKEKLLHKDL